MSDENVEIVRRVYAEWERGSFRTTEAFDPEVHVIWVNQIFVTGSETRGIDALGRAMQEFLSAWEDATATAGEFLDGGEHVVVENVWRARGKTSGIEVEAPLWSVWTLVGGRATRVVHHDDRAQALEAAGLPE
jgi:ketosteroid isomerase-like protein